MIAVGADDELFAQRPDVKSEARLVLYYGNFIPLHGVATIVEAAALLEPNGIDLVMIGDGPDREVVDQAIARTGISVERHGIIPLREPGTGGPGHGVSRRFRRLAKGRSRHPP